MSSQQFLDHHSEVVRWLTELTGESPAFEVTAETVDILHDIMVKSELQAKQSRLLCADAERRETEYTNEAKRLSSTLCQLGLSAEGLDSPSVVALETLACVGESTEIDDVHWSSFLIGLSHFSQAVEESHLKQLQLKHQQDEMMRRTKQALVHLNTLKQVHIRLSERSAAEASKTESCTQEVTFYRGKSHEYQDQIQQLKAKLRDNGFQPDIEHQHLAQLAKDLEQRKELLQPLKVKLNSFHNLPADVSLAKIKLGQLQKEVDSLEQQLSANINLMNS